MTTVFAYFEHVFTGTKRRIVSYGRQERAINIENSAQGYCFGAAILRVEAHSSLLIRLVKPDPMIRR